LLTQKQHIEWGQISSPAPGYAGCWAGCEPVPIK
jgi:hypothetical protein